MLSQNTLSNITFQVIGHVRVTDADTNEIILDKKNAIHPQNMARIIARALANEADSYVHRIAFGNGGTVTDPTGQIIFNPTNDGRDGSWDSRLYNETYSEIVDETNPDFGSDPGSAEAGNIRTGGGSVPEDDSTGGGVVSQEVGTKSNVVITVFLNKNEPTGQFSTINDFGVEIDATESTFVFDELGLYSSGLPAAATSASSSVSVGNKTSEDICTTILPLTSYVLNYTIDTVPYTTNITTPAAGSGPSGEFTYGDICEGLNTGLWFTPVTFGADLRLYMLVFITDRSGGQYPSITNKESYGLLTFQNVLSTGATSLITLDCDNDDVNDFFRALTAQQCVANVNVNMKAGQDEGSVNTRERLLTHLIFPPITKTADKALNIIYTLTVSVARSTDARIEQTVI